VRIRCSAFGVSAQELTENGPRKGECAAKEGNSRYRNRIVIVLDRDSGVTASQNKMQSSTETTQETLNSVEIQRLLGSPPMNYTRIDHSITAVSDLVSGRAPVADAALRPHHDMRTDVHTATPKRPERDQCEQHHQSELPLRSSLGRRTLRSLTSPEVYVAGSRVTRLRERIVTQTVASIAVSHTLRSMAATSTVPNECTSGSRGVTRAELEASSDIENRPPGSTSWPLPVSSSSECSTVLGTTPSITAPLQVPIILPTAETNEIAMRGVRVIAKRTNQAQDVVKELVKARDQMQELKTRIRRNELIPRLKTTVGERLRAGKKTGQVMPTHSSSPWVWGKVHTSSNPTHRTEVDLTGAINRLYFTAATPTCHRRPATESNIGAASDSQNQGQSQSQSQNQVPSLGALLKSVQGDSAVSSPQLASLILRPQLPEPLELEPSKVESGTEGFDDDDDESSDASTSSDVLMTTTVGSKHSHSERPMLSTIYNDGDEDEDADHQLSSQTTQYSDLDEELDSIRTPTRMPLRR